MKLRVRLTIESSIQCCSWDEFHGEAERLLGHPIWTHEFAMDSTSEDLHIALAAEDEGAFYHPPRALGPLDTMRMLMPDKPIIAVQHDKGGITNVWSPGSRGIPP